MSRRDEIRMSEAEVDEFLRSHKTIILCSNGPHGVPHPMPMWYRVDDDGAILMTTFRKSQKVRNLERDPRVSLLVEDGETYAQLRGVMLEGKVELERDVERILEVLIRVSSGYDAAPGADSEEMRNAMRGQAGKRVAMRVLPDRIVSWDHRKLGGVY